MTEQNQNTESSLAGEYVLGTLEADARQQFEQQMRRDIRLRDEVAAWEQRLAPMLDSIEPVAPPDTVWRALERGISPTERSTPNGFWHSLAFWRNFSLATSVLLVVLSVVWILPPQQPVSMDRMMVVLNDRSQAGWVVGASNQGLFQVQAVQPSVLPQGQVCQLWMQTPDQQMFLLGVLPHTGAQTFKSPVIVSPDARYKVSVEHKDNLPLDKPKGRIVFEGELVSI